MARATSSDMSVGPLAALSDDLAGIVEAVAPSIVRVDDGSRLTASGVIWDDRGTIVTTSHGTERDEDVTVVLSDGRRLPAVVAGRDVDTDLAVLTVDAPGLPAVAVADVDDARVGHLVLALGRPGEAGLQATFGVVSARLEAQSDGRPEYFLHTDATLYPGFSGGPLVDVHGRMAGLINLSLGRGQGMALGTPIIRHVVDEILRVGTVRRGYLGISTQSVAVPRGLRSDAGTEYGLLVVNVGDGSPAEQAGILLGDVLLDVAGQPVGHPEHLRRKLRSLGAGQSIHIALIRAGRRQEIDAVLGAAE